MNELEAQLKGRFCREQRKQLMDALILRVLGQGGLISTVLPQTEYRAPQVTMSQIVGSVLLKDKRSAIIEAPTGSGKSISYSVPAVIASIMLDKSILISTSTKNLQGQLIEKDLPLLQKMFETYLGLPFQYTVCQGRGNYLCLRRLHRMLELQSSNKKRKKKSKGKYEEINIEDMNEVPEALNIAIQRQKIRENLKTEAERKSFDTLIDWYVSDPSTGDIREFGVEVNKGAMSGIWEKVCSTSDDCMSWKCEYSKKCYFSNAKKVWEKSNICVVNHALFFANRAVVMSGGKAVIPASDTIIFDEADHVQTAAQSFYGLEIHSTWAHRMMERVLPHIGEKGCLYDIISNVKLQQKFINQANVFIESSKVFFDALMTHYLKPGEHIKRYKDDIVVDTKPLTDGLDEFIDLFARAHQAYENVDKDKASEASSFKNSFSRYKDNLINLTTALSDESCYFLEMGHKSSKYGAKTSLKSIPIDSSKSISRATDGYYCVYTSATLAANNTLDYFGGTIGVDPNHTDTTTAILPSPFNFQDNCIIYQPSMPQPNSPDFDSATTKEIMAIEPYIKGGIFVLFTSYSAMMNVVDQIRPILETQRNRRVFVQGVDGVKDKMIKKFRADERAVLFGVSSFWVGVDVRGTALSCVIITKMPFERPDEPINEAMREFLKRKNRSYFADYDLPKATMMIRQGFGRLIRTGTDYGLVVLLDPRLNPKSQYRKDYCHAVMKSLPKCPTISSINDVQAFFNKKEKEKK
jgi:ATP-dependent DNA helicase DinG